MGTTKEKHLKLPLTSSQVIFYGAITLILKINRMFRLRGVSDKREGIPNRRDRVSAGMKVR